MNLNVVDDVACVKEFLCVLSVCYLGLSYLLTVAFFRRYLDRDSHLQADPSITTNADTAKPLQCIPYGINIFILFYFILFAQCIVI